jgi:hypothetical protein
MKTYGIGQSPKGRAIHLSLQTDNGTAKSVCGRTLRVVDQVSLQGIKESPLYHFICYDCYRAVVREQKSGSRAKKV